MIRLDPPHSLAPRTARTRDWLSYYLGIPLNWAYQFFHNLHGILRVLDITRFRPLPAGLIPSDHPWVTGLNAATSRPIWFDNVLYRLSAGVLRYAFWGADHAPDLLFHGGMTERGETDLLTLTVRQ